MPSFGGRVPKVAMERLKNIKGKEAGCILLSIYGNRALEDTFVEIEDGAKACGFKWVS